MQIHVRNALIRGLPTHEKTRIGKLFDKFSHINNIMLIIAKDIQYG